MDTGEAAVERRGVQGGGAKHLGGRLFSGKSGGECGADPDRELGIGEPCVRGHTQLTEADHHGRPVMRRAVASLVGVVGGDLVVVMTQAGVRD
ncbi:hypothetical protein GCM10010168_18270 [Actinoplanes ianthinogenes]|uniref:Uncharacterized protein n=1 Tax=Actinoplanes ianthinogenes TaxID=122358 RepID=A0ABN6CV51_9ACTN|nr:hypothetical protein [Actinoplanes ianthinogenes]BCJ47469.1 hypothetical protein Aiant_81260 [Actinoplanes ianthinogenes]GGR01976.1 hypothetical protein GCM10010168_18270 [Actinoplanes ianthinogenes]